MTPKERARRSAAAILENDSVCRWFGIDLIEE